MPLRKPSRRRSTWLLCFWGGTAGACAGLAAYLVLLAFSITGEAYWLAASVLLAFGFMLRQTAKRAVRSLERGESVTIEHVGPAAASFIERRGPLSPRLGLGSADPEPGLHRHVLRGDIALITTGALVIILALAACTTVSTATGARQGEEEDPYSNDRIPEYFLSPCGTEGYPTTAAPRYDGPGPHPIVASHDPEHPTDMSQRLYSDDFPEEWLAPVDELQFPDVERSQLVICLTEIRRTGTEPIMRCDYIDIVLDLFPAAYTFEVRETASGRSIGEFDVESDDGGDASCPQWVKLWPAEDNEPAGVLRTWDADAHIDAAAPFVLADL
ncbi:MAG: hypothetical protein HOQ43_21160 [Glycomyces artemisiae]|uniref:Uncharacterized protein n=1 Tax=Glycomyces artemisiae TaxID=1076443 RepID=A0A850CGC9_9ACTN|nr:hypothetical protein [Glycomyces artemisiae]